MLACPTCGAANPPGSRFCNACGAPLPETDAGTREVGSERRVVTMLFCDVRGSTSMAETLDAEEWTDVMNAAYEVLIGPVVRHEGTVARLMGDAILAFFGAPTAHEDDPQRAVMAGLEIVSTIGPLRERLRTERGLDLNVRVGINTGPVVVGQVGSEHRQEYSAMGDAVNVAARMEQTAEPGTVQITEDTYRLVEGLFDVEALGGIELKGKREPVPAYRVLGRLAAPWRVRGARALEAPLIGRDAELATIRAALERTGEGVGSVLLLVGEPGIGKSRLVEEANAIWASIEPQEDRFWDFWQCVPYDAMQPHAQYRRAIRERTGIVEGDSPEIARTKIAEYMQAIAIHGWDEVSERVTRALLGVEREDEEPLEGEAFHRAATELVVGSTIAHGGRRLIVFEDLHWCDHASLDLIRATIDVVPTIPYVFLATYRPDREAPSWPFGEAIKAELGEWTTEIRLEPLGGGDSERLIAELLPHELSDDVRRRVLEKSEGSPLFVQEIARALIDRGIDDAAEIAIPDTVQSLITVGLDRLPGTARKTLQTASVIGRTFDAGVLRTVVGNGEVEPDIRELATRDLIRPDPPPPGAYTFRHALTQEAAYGSLLVKRRREVHLRVAEALEAASAGRLEDQAAVLAHHFAEAGDDERTLRYSALAGDAASRLYANAEAETLYRTAMDVARRIDDASLRSLYERRGAALEISARHVDAVANYEEMRTVARELGDGAMELAANSAIALLYATASPLFDPERGRALSEENVAMARRLGDRRAEARAWWNILVANIYGGGDTARAAEAGEASLVLSRELGEREQTASTLNDVSRAHMANGDYGTAAERLAEARALCVELGNEGMLCENLCISSPVRFLAGDLEDASAEAREALEIGERMGNRWGQSLALMSVCRIEVHRGDVGPALASIERCIEIGEAGGFAYAGVGGRADLAHLHTLMGDPEGALEIAARSREVALAMVPSSVSVPAIASAEALVALGDTAGAEAELAGVDAMQLPAPERTFAVVRAGFADARAALASGDPDRAAAAVDEVLAMLHRSGAEVFVADAFVLLARARLAQGRTEDAERPLTDAIERAERLGERLALMEALMLAAELPRSDAERVDLRGKAEAIAGAVAEGIADPALRAGFFRRVAP